MMPLKPLPNIFTKNIHWMLAVYALVTSLVLIVFMNKFSSTDMCNSNINTPTTGSGMSEVVSKYGQSSTASHSHSRYLFPVSATKIEIENISSFVPFSASSKINIWDLFVPQYSCSDLTRVGNVGDGGKFVCGLSFLRDIQFSRRSNRANNRQVSSASSNLVRSDINNAKNSVKSGYDKGPRCVVYSYGVSTDSSFEVDMVNGGLMCEVHAFDPTIGRMNIPSEYRDGSTDSQRGGGSITFHKLGLSESSGASTSFMLVEHLFDTMYRLNHSYIDILKIDVEGAEWNILPHLLRKKEGSSIPVFGQLLIELHYQSVPVVFDFFNSLSQHGFVSFSREVNLQPCLTGQLPRAVEYSFIHPDSFFNINSRFSNPPAAVSQAYHKPINAVIYFLTQKKRTKMMAGALQSLFNNFIQQFPQYPVLIFHDDLDSDSQNYLQRAVPGMNIKFVSIVLSVPENLKPFTLPERLPCSPHSSTMGYRHMISFHATLIHQYLFDAKNGYQHVEFLLRLDDDSSFNSPVGYDMFLLMRENNIDFGFVNTVQDDEKCVHGLWNHTRKFMNNKSDLISSKNEKQFHKWKEGLVIYNNFELSRVSIWKNKLWQNYISSIESSGGIYLKRWGDAPIHTIYVLLGVPLHRVHAFTDIAYRHDPFVNQTASGLPKPKSDPFAISSKCVYYDQWRCGNFTNTTNFTQIAVPYGPLHPQWSRDIYLRTPMVPSLKTSPVSSPYLKSIPYNKKIIYTFAHADRSHLLADTITSMFLNYAKNWPCGFVVFHFSNFNDSIIQNVRSRWKLSDVKVDVKFVRVPFSSNHLRRQYNVSSFQPTCSTTDPELFQASRFLISHAAQMLRGMGYDWFFRIADDAKLSQVVGGDLFDRLNHGGKRYGMLKVIKDNAECFGDLWTVVSSYCREEGVSCSPFFDDWPVGVVVLTNFEISHFSLWDSPVFKRVSLTAEQALDKGIREIFWSDAAIHTVSMVAYLRHKEVSFLSDVQYTANMNMKGVLNLSGNITYMKSNSGAKVVGTQHLPHLNNLFKAQRFGWLGGDVATSFALPSLDHTTTTLKSTGDSKTPQENCLPRRYIWLFGDSLIGTSTSTRRLEAEMISNSVALVDINPEEPDSVKRIESVNYFWRTDRADGQPLSIFSDDEMLVALMESRSIPTGRFGFDMKSSKFWPFTALCIKPANAELELLVIGQLVRGLNHEDEEDTVLSKVKANIAGGLSFVELASMATVVKNPYDPPSMWRTNPLVLNISKKVKDCFRWLSITTTANNGAFARDQDYIFALVSYNELDHTRLRRQLSDQATGFLTILRLQAKNFLEGDFSTAELLYQDDSKMTSVTWCSVHSVLDSGKKPFAIFPKIFTEPDFFFDFKRKEFTIVALEMSDSAIRICRSTLVEGPYLCVYSSDVKTIGDTRLTYAAKAHPELVHGNIKNGIIVSYIANAATGPTDLFNEKNEAVKENDLYVPLFLNIVDSPSPDVASVSPYAHIDDHVKSKRHKRRHEKSFNL